MRPTGHVSIVGITDSFGKKISLDRAVRYGWITPEVARGGPNMFVNQGRQIAAYALANRAPTQNFTIQKFGFGTGQTAARTTDVQMENPLEFAAGGYTKAVDSIDFPSPYILRVFYTLGLEDGNGYYITEFGLFTGDDRMLAHRIDGKGLSKTSDWSPTLTWRIRM